jgi:hyperosmotically inducible protein
MRTMHLITLIGCLFFTAALSAQRAGLGTGRYDSQIQQEATKLLQSKDKWRGITASTDDAIVTLSGAARLYIDKADAARRIGKIDHVDGVRNHIQVAGEVPDPDLKQKLATKLAYDRIGYGIAFNNLTLDVKNGVATVGGDVHDYPSRDSALAIVESTPGVKDVIDNINVLPTSPFDDDLRIRIAQAIYGDPALQKYALNPEKPIRIIVDNGHVKLEGVVNSQLDKTIAETRAKSVPNVFSVQNNLVIPQQAK